MATNVLRAIIRAWVLAIFFACIVPQAAFTDDQPNLTVSDDYVDVKTLEVELKTRNIDRIIVTLNAIKRMRYQGQILPYIEDLWYLKRDRYPDLPWDVIESDIIKVELADILLQAERNGFIDIETLQIHSYLSSRLDTSDVLVIRNSILALGTIDDPSDVPRILALAKRQKEGIFHAAVLTLAEMCNSSAKVALDHLEHEITDVELLEFLVSTREKIDRMKTAGRLCDDAVK